MNQALQGENLDLETLDQRVEAWKTRLSLLNEVPPRNFSIEANGVKFHDRSHILVQDFLDKSSEDLAQVWSEKGLPSIFEEVLTVFCANLVHFGEKKPQEFCTGSFVSQVIYLLHLIGYIDYGSPFLVDRGSISEKIGKDLAQIVERDHFLVFRETLSKAASDCAEWDNVYFKVPG